MTDRLSDVIAPSDAGGAMNIGGKSVVIGSINMGQYAMIIDKLQELIDSVGARDSNTGMSLSDSILHGLTNIRADGLTKLIEILAIATGEELDFVRALKLDEFTALTKAVIGLNWDVIEKKVLPQLAPLMQKT